jgi:hypothetical protein
LRIFISYGDSQQNNSEHTHTHTKFEQRAK